MKFEITGLGFIYKWISNTTKTHKGNRHEIN